MCLQLKTKNTDVFFGSEKNAHVFFSGEEKTVCVFLSSRTIICDSCLAETVGCGVSGSQYVLLCAAHSLPSRLLQN
jgi:hypothetical protein